MRLNARYIENRANPYGCSLFPVLCLLIFSLLLTGCGEEKARFRVGVSISGIAHPDSHLIKLALEENSSKFDTRIIYNREGLPEIFATGVDSLILSCFELKNLEDAIREIHRQGIPIVVLDCPPPQNLHVEAYIRIDYFGTGRMAAEYVAGEIDGKGNLVVLEGPRNDETARQITLGMYSVLEQYENLRIVASEQHPDWDKELAEDNVRATLQKYAGNIQAVIASSSQLAEGAIDAIVEQGLAGSIITAGIGANLATCEAIAVGKHDAEVDMMPYGRGLTALDLAIAVAEDKEFPYDMELGEQDPKIKVRFGPLRLITKENVSEMIKTWQQLLDNN